MVGSCQRPGLRVRRRGRARREGGVSSCCGRGAAHSTRRCAVDGKPETTSTTVHTGTRAAGPRRGQPPRIRCSSVTRIQNLMLRVHCTLLPHRAPTRDRDDLSVKNDTMRYSCCYLLIHLTTAPSAPNRISKL